MDSAGARRDGRNARLLALRGAGEGWIPGFRGFEEFTFAADTEEVAIMVKSGDTTTATKLKVGRKRAKGWRR